MCVLQAEHVCYQQFDAHLTSILSDDEQNYLQGQATSLEKNVWIGLSDSVSRVAF